MAKVDTPVLKRMLSHPRVHIELTEPFPVQGGRYLCLAKLVGPKRTPQIPQWLGSGNAAQAAASYVEATETLCVISEDGATPEEARRKLLHRLGTARTLRTVSPPRPRRGWLGRLITAFK